MAERVYIFEFGAICDDCGTLDIDVEYTPCPYGQEINNVDDYMWLCSTCWQARADDI